MDEREAEQRPINARPKGGDRLRAGVGSARTKVGTARTRVDGGVRAGADGVRVGADRARLAVEDAAWFMRQRVAWPVEDGLDALGTRGKIGVFGGGGIAVAGVVAALLIASPGGSGSTAGTTEAFVTPPAPTPTTSIAKAPRRRVAPSKPSGPTLHGAPPKFAKATDVHSGVGDGEALGGTATPATGEGPAARGSSAGAGDTPASSARIGSTPAASAQATAQASSLDKAINSGVPKAEGGQAAGTEELTGAPAPKAAKQVARHFAEAFVVYETGGIDSGVRETFGATSTKQLSKSLLKRPPRQPASVKVPQAKVVNVVAGPSRGKVYSVSVSLLRVGVTSELRLQMEQGVGKKWQVTNVLG